MTVDLVCTHGDVDLLASRCVKLIKIGVLTGAANGGDIRGESQDIAVGLPACQWQRVCPRNSESHGSGSRVAIAVLGDVSKRIGAVEARRWRIYDRRVIENCFSCAVDWGRYRGYRNRGT